MSRVQLPAGLATAAVVVAALAGCARAAEVPATPSEARPTDAEPGISIALAGDVMLGRLVGEAIDETGPAFPWGGMLPELRAPDLFLINMEFVLTAHTDPWRNGGYKAFYFRADPSAVEALQEAGVDFASTANNHAMDFQETGLLETIRVLDEAGIAHAGSGSDVDEARSPAVLSADGLKVAVLSWADYPVEWAATEDSPGINFTRVPVSSEGFAAIERAIHAAREAADFVVFSIHWGPNWRVRPPQGFRQFAHAVVDAGADVFWGHSAHIVQGVEFYGGKPILYDTGDFVDDYAVNPDMRNDLSALFVLHVPADQARVDRVEVMPVKIENMQVNHSGGKDREWFVERLGGLCAEMGTELVAEERRLFLLPAP